MNAKFIIDSLLEGLKFKPLGGECESKEWITQLDEWAEARYRSFA